jgi:hypothetical protein
MGRLPHGNRARARYRARLFPGRPERRFFSGHPVGQITVVLIDLDERA